VQNRLIKFRDGVAKKGGVPPTPSTVQPIRQPSDYRKLSAKQHASYPRTTDYRSLSDNYRPSQAIRASDYPTTTAAYPTTTEHWQPIRK